MLDFYTKIITLGPKVVPLLLVQLQMTFLYAVLSKLRFSQSVTGSNLATLLHVNESDEMLQ
jgi:hypothetical protein